MLFADLYVADPLAFHPVHRIVDEGRKAFKGEVLLIRKPSDHLLEVLPAKFQGVSVHCFLIGQGLAHSAFRAEQEMSRVLDIKGKSGGLSVDWPDGRNFHVYLGPLASEWGNYAAIGHDVLISLGDQSWKLPLLDINLAILDCEPVTQMRYIDPRLILVPPVPRIWTNYQ